MKRTPLLPIAIAAALLPLVGYAEPGRPVIRAQLLALLTEIASAAGAAGTAPDAVAAAREKRRAALRTIFETSGWPSRAAVGEDGTAAALLLVQEECEDRPLLQLAISRLHAATQRGEAPLAELARLIDAGRVGESRMQVYGTQYRRALDGKPVRFPIEDLEHVDQRRRLVGLPPLRLQETAMGLIAASPTESQGVLAPSDAPTFETRLQAARGLNSVRVPQLNTIYVHSRDSTAAATGERQVGSGLGDKSLQTSPRSR